ncbi:MAG: RusA family crossover junction endodeoxyribonuclease [Myxococcota bacterium]
MTQRQPAGSQMPLFRAQVSLSARESAKTTQHSGRTPKRLRGQRQTTEQMVSVGPRLTLQERLGRLDLGLADDRRVAQNLIAEQVAEGRILLHLEVPLPPAGKARPQIFRNGGKRYPKSHVNFTKVVRAFARAAWHAKPPLEVATLHVVGWFRRPRRLLRRKDRGQSEVYLGKPDADNAAGIPMDALVKEGVLLDDTKVARLVVTRFYVPLLESGDLACTPCTWITLFPWRAS